MERFEVNRKTNERSRIGARRRLATIVVGISATTLCAASALGVGNDMSGSCLNDVGRGAALWGTSSEVTTYSEPYLPYKTPEIYRIPVTSEQASQPPETADDYQGTVGNAMERLTESGTIFGTDGKLYEYTYTRGVEPRRIVETRRVQNSLGVWKEEQVEHIEWRPVLIRVLRPAGTNAKLEAQAAALRDAARNAIATPAPCDQVGAAEPKTFADQSGSNASTQTAPQARSETHAPPVEGTSPVVAQRREDASVRISTPSSVVGPNRSNPILTLPEEARRNAKKATEEKKTTTSKPSAKTQNAGLRQNQTVRK